jgi:hypothetical protein
MSIFEVEYCAGKDVLKMNLPTEDLLNIVVTVIALIDSVAHLGCELN